MFETPFFARRRPVRERLLRYGFTEGAQGYLYVTSVLNGELELTVFVSPDGTVSTRMTDIATGDEYILYKVASSVGSYVGEVRTACGEVLADISRICFEPDVYRGEQTAAVLAYAREKYGDEPEFLWEKLSDSAVLRRKDNQKWYAVFMTLSKRKLGLPSDEIAEIMDLRMDPAQVANTVDNLRYFPGWHMNKKSWYTVVLDGSVPTEELFRRMDESCELAGLKKKS